jgi:hypothetical protein
VIQATGIREGIRIGIEIEIGGVDRSKAGSSKWAAVVQGWRDVRCRVGEDKKIAHGTHRGQYGSSQECSGRTRGVMTLVTLAGLLVGPYETEAAACVCGRHLARSIHRPVLQALRDLRTRRRVERSLFRLSGPRGRK